MSGIESAKHSQPASAVPHRVAMVADPQLVDPHTYPGRPWPLSSLTVAFTDLYLKRSYKLLHRELDPDTVFFLGDLFDGGREWATHAKGFTPTAKEWKSYNESFWLKEYNRFGNIFFDPDQVSGGLPVTKAKKTIASLPGNHDLGFGNGIQMPIRDRFRAYFGEGDQINIVGNHTFVSLDTVSLSAMGQPDADDSIWNGTLLFLDQAQDLKAKAVREALSLANGVAPHAKHTHEVIPPHIPDAKYNKNEKALQLAKPEFPTIMLSHVPLYRDPGTPCGPLRERHPPSAPNLESDEPNAIRVAAGYQYQNVLTRDISKLIAEKVSNIGYAFSGDDHDYCELVHRSYPSAGAGIREITVKSMSWAMGVRKPGFLMVSLWNPVDSEGKSLHDIQGGQKMGDPTVQTHLCLLPDQLSIFIRYGVCAVLSLIVLAVHAVIDARKGGSEAAKDQSYSPVLPVSEPKQDWKEKNSKARSRAASGSMNLSSISEGNGNSLSARSYNARTRSVSPMPISIGTSGGAYGLPTYKAPLIEQAGYYGSKRFDYQDGPTDDWGNPPVKLKPRKPKTFIQRLGESFGRSLVVVGGSALVWYWWLLKH